MNTRSKHVQAPASTRFGDWKPLRSLVEILELDPTDLAGHKGAGPGLLKLIAIALVRYARQDAGGGGARPAVATLARAACVTLRSARRALRVLETLGIIEREFVIVEVDGKPERKPRRGSHGQRVYRLRVGLVERTAGAQAPPRAEPEPAPVIDHPKRHAPHPKRRTTAPDRVASTRPDERGNAAPETVADLVGGLLATLAGAG